MLLPTEKNYKHPSDYVGQAKSALVLARALKQQEQIIRDCMTNDLAATEDDIILADDLARKSQLLRLSIKTLLKHHEEVIGRFYIWGYRYPSLQASLRGKDFKVWPEYRAVFGSPAILNEDIWK